MEGKKPLYDGNDLLSTLIYMKKEFGADVFHNARKMSSILGDLAPTLKRDGKVLQRLIVAGMFQELEKTDFANEIEKLRARGRVKNWLIDEEFIQEEKAVYYSQVLCAVYAGDSERIVVVEENKESCGETFKGNISTYIEETKENKIVENEDADFVIEDGVLKKYEGVGFDVIIPEGIREIGKYAFLNCISLESIIVPESLEIIKEGAFRNCINLRNIELPKSLKEIGKWAFAGCGSLESIKIPESVKTIENYTFQDCINLRNIEFSKNLKKIGGCAFLNCKSLENVKLSKSIKWIGPRAFASCDNLSSIVIEKDLEYISVDEDAFPVTAKVTVIKE